MLETAEAMWVFDDEDDHEEERSKNAATKMKKDTTQRAENPEEQMEIERAQKKAQQLRIVNHCAL